MVIILYNIIIFKRNIEECIMFIEECAWTKVGLTWYTFSMLLHAILQYAVTPPFNRLSEKTAVVCPQQLLFRFIRIECDRMPLRRYQVAFSNKKERLP